MKNELMKLSNRSIRTMLMITSLSMLVIGCHDPYTELETADKTFPEIEVAPIGSKKLADGKDVFHDIIERGDQNFQWKQLDDFDIWSAVSFGDTTVAVEFNFSTNGLFKTREAAVDYIVDFIKWQNRDQSSQKDILIQDMAPLNTIILKINSYESLARLRKLSLIRYVEPWGFDEKDLKDEIQPLEQARVNSIGCDQDFESSPLSSYYNGFSGFSTKVSWHLEKHNVDDAWFRSTGKNIGIGLIDTKISGNQAMLSPIAFDWDAGHSRSITKYDVTTLSSSCDGHATSMAGMIAGPVNNSGAITGVAPHSDLHHWRAAKDVITMSLFEKAYIASGLVSLSSNASIKVINISLGYKIKLK